MRYIADVTTILNQGTQYVGDLSLRAITEFMRGRGTGGGTGGSDTKTEEFGQKLLAHHAHTASDNSRHPLHFFFCELKDTDGVRRPPPRRRRSAHPISVTTLSPPLPPPHDGDRRTPSLKLTYD